MMKPWQPQPSSTIINVNNATTKSTTIRSDHENKSQHTTDMNYNRHPVDKSYNNKVATNCTNMGYITTKSPTTMSPPNQNVDNVILCQRKINIPR